MLAFAIAGEEPADHGREDEEHYETHGADEDPVSEGVRLIARYDKDGFCGDGDGSGHHEKSSPGICIEGMVSARL